MQTNLRSRTGDRPVPHGALSAVFVEGAYKTFRIPHQQYHTLKERALHPFRSRTYDDLHALNDVSVAVQPGEFFGIVGRNGSGKSTLLKCLAGIYELDGGRIGIDGRLSPFIELGVGFNPDLAARDNVLINGVMLGLSRAEARRRFDAIIEFAELEEFVDLKLKNYSSGMAVRLGFSVATQVDADILLVDEVLAVGDAAFQQKCYEAFQRMKEEGKTILLVTHDMGLVEHFCDRAMLLERGEMLALGEPREIGRLYHKVNFGRLVHEEAAPESQGTPAEITGAWYETGGERIAEIAQGEPLEICVSVQFNEEITDPVFAVTLRNEVGHTVFATSTQWTDAHTGRFEAGETVTVRTRLDAWFAPSRYSLSPSVALAGSGANALDLREDLTSIIVHSTRMSGGIVDPPHTVHVERTGAAVTRP